MNILLVTDAYPPEVRSSSHLMQELAEELRDRNHIITVCTCYPQYNLPETMVKEYPEVCMENGIRVIRIRTLPHHKVNFLVRGIAQLTLPFIFNHKLRRHLITRQDAVIVYSPPLPLWRVGYYIKHTHNSRFILNVQDIFPQNAIDLGALRNPLLIRYFQRMEKKAYDSADFVTVHSEGNASLLFDRNKVSQEKLVILHNWVDVNAHKETKGFGKYRKSLKLDNSFIFFFGGVIGPSQGLDLILDAAKIVRSEKEIVFLFVGDGSEKNRLEKRVREEKLKNVMFHPFISKEEYAKLVKEIDVGLVCLNSKNKTPVVPGKILSYMAAGIPVLAFLNRESDGHKIIREASCGYSEVSEDPKKAADLILKMYKERSHLKKIGYNGFNYVLKNFSKEKCVDKLEDLLRS